MTAEATPPAATPFALIGGAETIDHLVEAFYRNMDVFPEAKRIRAMHAADLTEVKAVLKLYLAEWLGGPAAYSAAKGHPRLRMRHARFPIGPDERDAWMLCMSAALKEVIADEAAREAIKQNMAKLADWMRNDPNCAHDQRH
jgi:hemoglobin